MGLVLFYWTLLVMLFSMVASATCLSSYLVSHKKTYLYLFVAFLMYFLDVSFVFQDEYALHILYIEFNGAYAVIRSLILIITGLGVLESFWLMVCDYLRITNKKLLVIPGVVFVAASLLLLFGFPDTSDKWFCFYTTRALFALWIIGFGAFAYFNESSEVLRNRLWRRKWIVIGIAIMVFGIVFEDAIFFLVLKTDTIRLGPLVLSSERNYVENYLMLCIGFIAIRDSYKTLSLRFEMPPSGTSVLQEQEIVEVMPRYAKLYQLSSRECEVLHEILLGKDNQNIASQKQLALSTVKVHVHNILQKTGKANRQEVIQDFWRTS
ncbi:LuxR C-terminal-related transcriptional regulator [Adlercreutzia agrestimuris]|uniref:LuxR C-terminal-related transcriptional regulator n=1 Tax=Adlercreutzia agrestimuris TaxID=2941324 RepID=UPI00203BD564|nr:LuxR C-terminal-related transcriptional regulator [Adlercreutzia agrestimuris]